MAQQRTRNITTYIAPRDPRAGQRRVARLNLTYYSNRENGQIVKRESPMTMTKELYTRYKPSDNLDVSNEPASYDTQGWIPSTSVAYARAYGKFKSLAAMPSSEVLLNVVESRKSLEMITARAFQIRNLLNSARKGRLGDAWRYMSLNPDSSLLAMKNGRRSDSGPVSRRSRESSMDEARKWRQLVKDVGAATLEIRYGWVPLMQDIKGAIDTLSEPIPDVALRASKVAEFSYNPSGWGVAHVSERCTIKGRIRVSNPNLDLANRLGLINPASVLWEAVPFSFLVDWFLPVGNFLQGFTDFVGLELIDGSITSRRTAYVEHAAGYRYIGLSTNNTWDTDYASYQAVKMVRTVTTSLPRPPLTTGRGLSPGRAVNAVALLATAFNPRKGASIRGGDA